MPYNNIQSLMQNLGKAPMVTALYIRPFAAPPDTQIGSRSALTMTFHQRSGSPDSGVGTLQLGEQVTSQEQTNKA
jgi:hypothetical protein